jgi:hypothetical protein
LVSGFSLRQQSDHRWKNVKSRRLEKRTPSTIKAFEYEEIFEMIKPYLEEFAEITTGNDRERSTRANGNKPKVV